MANKGCNSCLHYKIGEMKMWEDDVPSKCLLGKDEEFRLWWEENGRKRSTDELTDMDCFQETKLGEFCNEARRLLDEIRKSEQLCGNLDENHNCKNMCLTRCVDGNKFYK